MSVSATSVGIEESQKGSRVRRTGKTSTLIDNIFLHCNSSNKGNGYPSVAWHNGLWGV